MKKNSSLATLLAGLFVTFLTTACANNSDTQDMPTGMLSGGGNAQVFSNPTLPLPSPPLKSSETQGNKWGAIAYTPEIAALDDSESPILFGIGVVKNYGTAEEAKQAAMAVCEADGIAGCQVQATYQRQCLALTYSPKSLAFAWAVDMTKEEARQKSEQICAQYAQGQACQVMTAECPDLAGTPLGTPPLAVKNPEVAAKISHQLAVQALYMATQRDQGVSYEQARTPHKDSDAPFDGILLSQLKMIYGPFKNYPPEQIYRMMMLSYLYEMSY